MLSPGARADCLRLFRVATPLLALLLGSNVFATSPLEHNRESKDVQINVTQKGDIWTYKVKNLGRHPISVVTLMIEAPFLVENTPNGWSAQTDGCSTVAWTSKDSAKPFENDIAPGRSLMFSIKSGAKTSTDGQYIVQPWNDEKGSADFAVKGTIEVPGTKDGNCAHD